MMETNNVSKRLLARLPNYLNYIKSLPGEATYISATKIALALGLGDVLVRKDLAKVSSGGRRKTGYNREGLIQDIEAFLGFNSTVDAVIVGVGKLGQALLDYTGFQDSGMNILAGFDIAPVQGKSLGGKKIYTMDRLKRFCREKNVRMGIISVPADAAQEVCDLLVECGVKAIWSFAPVHLVVPKNVAVHSENLVASLTALCVQLKMKEKDGNES